MSVLNIFKKKKTEEKKRKEVKEEKVEKKVAEGKKNVRIKKELVLEGSSSALLLHPYLSEKSTILRDKENKYIFKVNSKATRNEIKKLLEDIYHVDVIKINVINTPTKVRKWRQKKSHFGRNKKMIVTIKEGQKIELGI